MGAAVHVVDTVRALTLACSLYRTSSVPPQRMAISTRWWPCRMRSTSWLCVAVPLPLLSVVAAAAAASLSCVVSTFAAALGTGSIVVFICL